MTYCRKLRALLTRSSFRQGSVVVSNMPGVSFALSGFSGDDTQFHSLAKTIWNDIGVGGDGGGEGGGCGGGEGLRGTRKNTHTKRSWSQPRVPSKKANACWGWEKILDLKIVIGVKSLWSSVALRRSRRRMNCIPSASRAVLSMRRVATRSATPKLPRN